MICPECGARGRSIKTVTLQAQTDPPRYATLESSVGWAMCMGAACDVAYFRDRAVIGLPEIGSVPFHKSADPQRLACFCFGHSVGEVEADVDEAGVSRIQARIKAACRAGEDDCARKNPAGRCCLGDVGQVVKAVGPPAGRASVKTPSSADPASAGDVACCDPPRSDLATLEPAQASRAGWLTGGAVAAGVLASACCWIPLLAVGLGTSAAGAGTLFAAWRLPLLAIAAVCLTGGFYLAYRAPRCAPDSACEALAPGARRASRVLLWMSTALVLGMASYPELAATEFAGTLFADARAQLAPTTAAATVYSINGMSCRACEAHVIDAVGRVEGVASVRVSYADRDAAVAWTTTPDHQAVLAALKSLGYSGRVRP
ncbi:MAG: copper chaperone CopZ [Bradymonadia bacterium]|jgi:copper chaperone CopZ